MTTGSGTTDGPMNLFTLTIASLITCDIALLINRSHEWVKHGTCVTTLNPTCYGSEYTPYQDVVDYFEVSILAKFISPEPASVTDFHF